MGFKDIFFLLPIFQERNVTKSDGKTIKIINHSKKKMKYITF